MNHLTNSEINDRLLFLAECERKTSKEILELINLASQRRFFLDMGYAHIFEYCIKHLKFSETVTYQRIASAKLLTQIPELGEKLDRGALNLTQLSNFQSAVKAQDKVEKVGIEAKKNILYQLENISSRQTKRLLVQNLPAYEPEQKKEIHYKKNESVQMSLTLTKEQFEKLEKVKALLSHKVPDLDLIKVIEVLCDQEIKKRTEIKNKDDQKSKSAADSAAKKLTQSFVGNTKSCDIKAEKARPSISITLRKQIFEQYNFECQFKHENHQCKSKHFLEIEHIKPIAFGGDNDLKNLTLLCRNHNQHQARKAGLISP